jgi:N-acetylneuraminate synthase/N,N'-diacetyllegionaminate synthase
MKKVNGIPYLIAEIGGNHEGDFEICKAMLNSAIRGGTDGVKFQIYTGETIVNKFVDPNRAKHFDKFALSHDQYLELADMCDDAGVDFLASIWDYDALDLFSERMPFIKIGSGDLTAFPFLKKISNYNKPILLSTGLSNFKEIEDAYNFIKECNPYYDNEGTVGIMQCTSMYPIPDEEANLSIISELKLRFPKCLIGYSDHTEGQKACELASLLGVDNLEFHFTLESIQSDFRDHKVSFTENSLIQLKKDLIANAKFMGSKNKQPTKSEIESGHTKSFRRALYLNKDCEAGEVILESHLIALRPSEGIPANQLKNIIGKTLSRNVKAFEPLHLNDFI